MPNYKQIAKHGDEGVTVTFRHRDDGVLMTTVTPGEKVREALRAALEPWDPQEWQIVSISTPQTIYDDLIMRRQMVSPGENYNCKSGETIAAINGTPGPEVGLLGGVGGSAYL